MFFSSSVCALAEIRSDSKYTLGISGRTPFDVMHKFGCTLEEKKFEKICQHFNDLGGVRTDPKQNVNAQTRPRLLSDNNGIFDCFISLALSKYQQTLTVAGVCVNIIYLILK